MKKLIEKFRHQAVLCRDMKESADLWNAGADALERASTEVSELKALIADVASAPFPIHDHCSKEHWERACHIYNETADSGRQK